jgi:hypothetical protein
LALVLAALIALVPLAACESPPPPRMIDQYPQATLSEATLRATLHDFGRRYIAVTEATAARIRQENPGDTEIRRRTLIWRLRINQLGVQALLRPDPVASMIDMWAFSAQVTEYLESGDGSDLFGASQELAVKNARRLEAEAESIAHAVLGDEGMDHGRELVAHWVETYPLEGESVARASTARAWADLIGSRRGDVFRVNQTLEEGITSLSDRLDVMSSVMPRLMILQLELLIEDRFGSLDARELAGLAERALEATESLPEAVDVQRDALMAALRREGDEVLAEVDRQRLQTLEEVEDLIDRSTERAFERGLVLLGIAFLGGLVLVLVGRAGRGRRSAES